MFNLKNYNKIIVDNYKSAITVALVNIPLSLALAIASGATPTQGIITAFWAGLIGALIGGSNFNIIGPTGALSGILVSIAIVKGYAVLPVVALLSGVIILIIYILRLDRYIIFIPQSVVHGFTLGVAVILILGQLENIFGITDIEKSSSMLQNTWNYVTHFEAIHLDVFIVFAAFTIFIFGFNKKFRKFPGSIVVAAFAILVIALFRDDFTFLKRFLILGDKYTDIESTLFTNSIFNVDYSIFFEKEIWIVSITTSLIAVLETLLSGQIAARMTKSKFNRSKEVLSLSLANIASGIAGGIPATAALARTALNIRSGANHRFSGVLNALIVGVVAIFFFGVFKLLPMVAIASMLVIVAIGMIEAKHFIKLLDDDKVSFLLSFAVAAITVLEDPIVGILVGTVIALLVFVSKVSNGQTEILNWKDGVRQPSIMKNDLIKMEHLSSDLVVYKITGTLTYINMPAHVKAVEKIRGNKYVIVSLRYAFYADSDGVEYLSELIETLKNNNEKIYLAGINKAIEGLIVKEDFYKTKIVEGKIFNRTSEAMKEIIKFDPAIIKTN